MIKSLIEQGYPLTAQYYYGIRGLAGKLAHKYGKTNLEDDFIQVALATACRAEKRYDANAGASFYTYINKIIKSDIQKEFGNPNRHTKKYKIIQKFITEYDKVNGRYPDVHEISKGTSLSRFEILSVYYDRYREQTLDSSLDEGLMKDPFENKDYSWITEHLDCLDPDEAYVIDAIYTHELNADTIANAIGITKAHVYKLQHSALEKLKQSVKDFE